MNIADFSKRSASFLVRGARLLRLRLTQYRGPAAYFIWTVIASLVPLWLGVLLLFAYGKWAGEWELFYENGEFYLYSTAYLAHAIYVLRKKKAEEGGMHFLLTLTAALLLVVVAALYASLNTSQVIFAQTNSFTPEFLRQSSLFLFGLSLLFSLYALVADLDPLRVPANRDVQNDQVKELEEKFNEEPV
jgi:hypothetical protein